MKRLGSLMLVMALSFNLVSCQKEAEEAARTQAQGNKTVNLSIGSYTVAKSSPLDLIFPKAYAAISEFKVCFKRLRFKRDLEDTVDPLLEDNVDINLGEVTLTTAGIDLGSYNIPVGLYKRIEFDLEEDCNNGEASSSASIMNDFGTFGSLERITIKFDGTFDLSTDTSLQLGIQNIINAVNSYDGVGSVRDMLEGVSGEL